MPSYRVLDLAYLEVAHSILLELFEGDAEPLPSWGNGDRVKLETIAACTEVVAFGQSKYPDLPSKAAKLFYSTIKIHPFSNGNKRFAFCLTLAYLVVNDHRLMAATGIGADVAKWVADSDPHSPEGEPDGMCTALANFFVDFIEPWDWRAELERENDES
jgi:death-on-curing family protein